MSSTDSWYSDRSRDPQVSFFIETKTHGLLHETELSASELDLTSLELGLSRREMRHANLASVGGAVSINLEGREIFGAEHRRWFVPTGFAWPTVHHKEGVHKEGHDKDKPQLVYSDTYTSLRAYTSSNPKKIKLAIDQPRTGETGEWLVPAELFFREWLLMELRLLRLVSEGVAGVESPPRRLDAVTSKFVPEDLWEYSVTAALKHLLAYPYPFDGGRSS